jgi:hypothetical protein
VKPKPKTGIGYEDDLCHFCGANEAGYGREEKGKVYDACSKCAKASIKGGTRGESYENRNDC